ncbi:hypothetical protein DRA42_04915 [Ethanoligenens harbinense]|nr:hypothetical protein CXQ68_04900 [Ethanoligenens harbinense YUAN-3]AYF38291.1 hypothetical protein CXP51_04760 [Ethanoligenens harbinense]AYF41037.1 hypothetical protein CN246_04895 [Ethanoligenens harbinense]QCN91868.1 hypothetical protein DRA42_04915 [Ethanoligenens harbinense]
MEILRQKNVRLIALNDGVDSARNEDDFTPFRNIMNETVSLRRENEITRTAWLYYHRKPGTHHVCERHSGLFM